MGRFDKWRWTIRRPITDHADLTYQTPNRPSLPIPTQHKTDTIQEYTCSNSKRPYTPLNTQTQSQPHRTWQWSRQVLSCYHPSSHLQITFLKSNLISHCIYACFTIYSIFSLGVSSYTCCFYSPGALRNLSSSSRMPCSHGGSPTYVGHCARRQGTCMMYT